MRGWLFLTQHIRLTPTLIPQRGLEEVPDALSPSFIGYRDPNVRLGTWEDMG